MSARVGAVLALVVLMFGGAPAWAASPVSFDGLPDGTLSVFDDDGVGDGVFTSGAPLGAAQKPKVFTVGNTVARSGTKVLDISNTGGVSEFGEPNVNLTFHSPKDSVTLYARVAPGQPNVFLRLEAFKSTNAAAVAQTPLVSHSAAEGWFPLTVSRLTDHDIKFVRLWSGSADNHGFVYVDDMQWVQASGAPDPDYSIGLLGTSGDTAYKGVVLERTVTIDRVGDVGPIKLTAGGAPDGSVVQVTPSTITGATTTATVKVTVPESVPTGTVFTLSVNGESGPGVGGPSPTRYRLASIPVTVKDILTFARAGSDEIIKVPTCSAATVPVQVFNAKNESVKIEAIESLPGLPVLGSDGLELPAGGSQGTFAFPFNRADSAVIGRYLVRLRATPAEGPPAYLDVDVQATGPEVTEISEIRPPDRMQAGQPVTVYGHGFCDSGGNNSNASASPTVGSFGTPTLNLLMGAPVASPTQADPTRQAITSLDGAPRGAGRTFTITTAAGATATINGQLRSTRYNAFTFPAGQFWNADARAYVELFGPDDVYGGGQAEDPIFELFRRATSTFLGRQAPWLGFALGLDRLNRFLVDKVPSFPASLRDVTDATPLFVGRSDVPREPRPPVWSTSAFINIQQLNQFGVELLTQLFDNGGGTMQGGLTKVLQEGALPLVVLGGVRGGQALAVHDLVPLGNGYRLHVYDPETPLTDSELANAVTHEKIETQSFIDVVPGRWTYVRAGSIDAPTGTFDQIAWLDPRKIPTNPTSALHIGAGKVAWSDIVFSGRYALTFDPSKARATTRAAAVGTVRSFDTGDGSTFALLSKAKSRRVTLKPSGRGQQLTRVTAGGGVQSIDTSDACPPCPNRVAELTDDGIALVVPKGRSKAKLTVSRRVGGKARVAIAEVTTSGRDVLELKGSSVVVRHTGAAANVKLTLSQDHSGFASTIKLKRGETLKSSPTWSEAQPKSVRATISKSGRTRSVSLRNTLKPAVLVRSVKVSAKRSGSTLQVTVQPSSSGKSGVLVATVKVRSGGKEVGKATQSVAAGARSFTVPAPLKSAGKKLVVEVTVEGIAAPPALGRTKATKRITIG